VSQEDFPISSDDQSRPSDKLVRLALNLQQMKDDPGKEHICPVCGGKVYVDFSVYISRGEEKLGIDIWCEGCQLRIALDGRSPIPIWAKPSS